MDEGVDIPLSDGIIIGKDVKIGHDTVILPNTIIKGKTVIGNGCEIGPNSYIADCVIEDNVILNNVQAHESKVDSKAKAGPFVHLRPNTHLHSGVKIGDFVEVKNSEIGLNTCIAHLTYIGDSDVGKGVNFVIISSTAPRMIPATDSTERKTSTCFPPYAFFIRLLFFSQCSIILV